MTKREWEFVNLYVVAFQLASEWNIHYTVAEGIVRGALRGGQVYVRGRGLYDIELRDISKEIGATLMQGSLISREFDDVEVDWQDLLEHGRPLVPTAYKDIVAAAEAHETTARRTAPKMTKREAVADFIRETYPDGMTGVSYKEIAYQLERKRGLRVDLSTIARALGRK